MVFPADLLEILFQDYDVIVGMDWLHMHHALVDCRLKQMNFRTPAYSHIVVQGERSLTTNIISAVLSSKMICQGCDSYLAHIVDTRLGIPSLKDIPTVCDFPAVFLDDLPGLPPEREIEFPIELVPGTTPISTAPYRMAPAKLKELKAQLQELIEKGFICASISPWGAPVLFVKNKDGTLRLCIDYRQLNKDDKCQESFENLKSLLTQAPILSLPAEGKDYVVYNDVSHHGLGCVLMQEGKNWRHYLYEEKCHIFTDHKSLKYLGTQKELNLRQRKWLELIKDYDCTIDYHPGKANVVADALSRNSFESLALSPLPLLLELRATNACLSCNSNGSIIANLQVKPVLLEFCVPNDDKLRKQILIEAHSSPYAMHPGGTKMYRTIKENYLWSGMKKDIA
ncbi:uncharacterized protein LOC142173711 [Nicotiana tabacum]|uniref:Uncharacterized protein LOC142173711 n=1 Tax=Nicotiana tabacum TaxID=4097 RepID=A0AC58TDX9_TOBAC